MNNTNINHSVINERRIQNIISSLQTNNANAQHQQIGMETVAAAQQPVVSVKCSMDPSQKATVICLACRKYLCKAWDIKSHESEQNKKHIRYPITQLRSYVVFDEPSVAGESDIRRNWATRNGPIQAPLSDVKTLYDNFQRSARLFGDRPCIGVRTANAQGKAGSYKFQTYREVAARVGYVASALKSLNLDKKARVGLYSINRPEWVIAEQASFAHSYVTVPLYDTLGADAAKMIIAEAGVSVVFCSADKLATLRQVAESKECTCLKYVVVMPRQALESPTEHQKYINSWGTNLTGASLLTLEEMETKGKAQAYPVSPPSPTDICTLCYTSGTTGQPKGAILTHANLVSDVAAALQHGIEAGPTDVHISFLPLAHMFERVVHNLILGCGAAIGYFRGDTLLLLDDVAELKPTIFVAVPRLYNRLYDKVMATIKQESGPVKKYLFHKALSVKEEQLRTHGQLKHWLWDALVFGKISAKMGGRVKLMITGSAPISPNVLEFLRIVFGCQVIEGYGMTESTAASTATPAHDLNSVSNVGIPLVCNEIKLVDVPDMGYTSQDIVDGLPQPRGEVWMRGTNIFQGYYKQTEQTKEALTENGWLKSGDVGMWLPDQTLKIIDRKKNMFKLAQGEYVAAEKIENIYSRCKYIAQIFVYGDSMQSELVAIVVPDQEVLTAWAKSQNINKSYAELVKLPAVKKMILEDMLKQEKTAQLRGFEKVKSIFVDGDAFTVENNLLTPTFKLKRNVAKEKYQTVIAQLYNELNKQTTSTVSKL